MTYERMLRTYLVEDNATIRQNLAATLEDLAQVTTVGWADGEHDANLWLMREDAPWDLAIVDLFLKQGSGFDVLKACARRGPRQRVIILSNYATPAVRARYEELGADAVFDKSTDIDALIDYCTNLRSQLAGAG